MRLWNHIDLVASETDVILIRLEQEVALKEKLFVRKSLLLPIVNFLKSIMIMA